MQDGVDCRADELAVEMYCSMENLVRPAYPGVSLNLNHILHVQIVDVRVNLGSNAHKNNRTRGVVIVTSRYV